jgi:hypothetical protein
MAAVKCHATQDSATAGVLGALGTVSVRMPAKATAMAMSGLAMLNTVYGR